MLYKVQTQRRKLFLKWNVLHTKQIKLLISRLADMKLPHTHIFYISFFKRVLKMNIWPKRSFISNLCLTFLARTSLSWISQVSLQPLEADGGLGFVTSRRVLHWQPKAWFNEEECLRKERANKQTVAAISIWKEILELWNVLKKNKIKQSTDWRANF